MRPTQGIVAILFSLAACVAGARAEPVSFKQDLLGLFKKQCVSCHMTGAEQGNLGLAPSLAYRQLVGVDSLGSPLKRVEPGAPEQSYLLHKLRGTHLEVGGSGMQMPMGLPPLPEETLAAIRSWIEDGAPNN